MDVMIHALLTLFLLVQPLASPPISNWQNRVTKKPFGIHVSPKDSPVKPERFAGYHTGVDFETSPDEKDAAVPVNAICDGTLVMKKWATGYGGVAVERCVIDKQTVTVVYGHIKLASVTSKVG